VQIIEQKIDHLATSMQSAFNGVDEAFADQRIHTELGIARVGSGMDRCEARIEARLSRLEGRIDQLLDLHLRKAPAAAAESL
jgi:hypothetical protein